MQSCHTLPTVLQPSRTGSRSPAPAISASPALLLIIRKLNWTSSERSLQGSWRTAVVSLGFLSSPGVILRSLFSSGFWGYCKTGSDALKLEMFIFSADSAEKRCPDADLYKLLPPQKNSQKQKFANPWNICCSLTLLLVGLLITAFSLAGSFCTFLKANYVAEKRFVLVTCSVAGRQDGCVLVLIHRRSSFLQKYSVN